MDLPFIDEKVEDELVIKIIVHKTGSVSINAQARSDDDKYQKALANVVWELCGDGSGGTVKVQVEKENLIGGTTTVNNINRLAKFVQPDTINKFLDIVFELMPEIPDARKEQKKREKRKKEELDESKKNKSK